MRLLPASPRDLLPLGVGLAAAGVGTLLGAAVERVAVGRPLRPGTRDPNRTGVPFGSVHAPGVAVTADDGTLLHVEVDEPDDGPGAPAQVPTIVFSHGYALTLDSWHHQRLALRGRYRLVFWDQRGHGRSATGPHGSATIDQLGRDLARVVRAVAPDGPLVLVGHSMGGMTVLSLADGEPDLVRDRVIGVALVATSAGNLGQVDFGLPHLGRVVQRLAPVAVRALSRTPGLVERSRRVGSDLEALIVRKYSFASPVPGELVRFAADMIASTRLEVISEYLPTFATHDKIAALAALDGHEVLVLVGDGDLLTPVAHSEEIVRRLPGAEHVVVRDAGHLVMLEHPEVVTMHLAELVARAQRSAAPSRSRRHGPASRRTVTPVRPRQRRRDGAA